MAQSDLKCVLSMVSCIQAAGAFLQHQQRRASRPRPHCELRTWQVGVIRNGHGVSQSDMTASCHAMSRTLTSSIQFSASNQFLNPSAGSCQIVASPPLRSITILYCIDPPTACPACATSSGSRSAPSFDREGAAGGSQRVELYQPARYRLENVEQR